MNPNIFSLAKDDKAYGNTVWDIRKNSIVTITD